MQVQKSTHQNWFSFSSVLILFVSSGVFTHFCSTVSGMLQISTFAFSFFFRIFRFFFGVVSVEATTCSAFLRFFSVCSQQ